MTESINSADNAGLDTELLTLDEASRFLDTSKTTLYRLIKQSDITGVKVGKQWRFRPSDLTAYLERGRVVVSAAPQADLDTCLDFFSAELLAIGSVLPARESNTAEMTGDLKTNTIAQMIIHHATASKASDVHIGPQQQAVRVRYRIDGVLNEIADIPKSVQDSLTARIKAMAEMSTEERRLPQEGRIAAKCDGKDYDIRVSSVPSFFGENIVMRILDRSSALLGLNTLGFVPSDQTAIEKWLHRNGGLLITSGPTGSGKTTTLYSCLSRIDSTQKNLTTIENPIEYQLPGVVQMQINRKAGITYPAALRAILRQDPDIIMAGEIRDFETAQICMEAASTGHLVMSTFHVEDAPSVISRLVEMGVEKYLVSGNVIGVIAQRLARRLCPHCRTEATSTEQSQLLTKVAPLSAQGGFQIRSDSVFYTANGCDECRGTGFQGRTGLFEVLSCTPQLVQKLMNCSSNEEVTRIAVGGGMTTLLADGLRKAADGVTSIDEVLRATGTWL